MPRMPADSFLASSVASLWGARVRSAKQSIAVYTPYFDHFLVRLLQEAAIPPSQITVVTDLSPRSGNREYGPQLRAALDLARWGVDLRSLDRLHAKVLVVDRSRVTVGSQNFTSYARRSRETTVVPRANLAGSDFLATLKEWEHVSVRIEPGFLEKLIGDLAPIIEKAEGIADELDAAFDRLRDGEQVVREARERAASTQPRGAQLRVAHEVVPARVEWLEYAGYSTLMADRRSRLDEWTLSDTGATVTLDKLRMYPLISRPSGRLAYARVAKTRITYLRFGLDRSADPVEIGGVNYKADITLRDGNMYRDRANVYIALVPEPDLEDWSGSVSILFDGTSAEPVGVNEYGAKSAAGDHAERLRGALETSATVDRLMDLVLEEFTYAELGVDEHNAEEVFGSGKVELTLIMYREHPILIATPASAE